MTKQQRPNILVIPAGQYLQQLQNASEWAAKEHRRLLAEGYKWDGMDGYYKTEEKTQ